MAYMVGRLSLRMGIGSMKIRRLVGECLIPPDAGVRMGSA